MYYVMGTRAGEFDPARIGSYPRIPSKGLLDAVIWIRGRRFNRTIPTPLQFEIDPNYGRDMPDLFTPNIPLFHDRLIGALNEVGVDNLDLYDALLLDPRDDRKFTDYKAVNVIGMVTAADMRKSKIDGSSSAEMLAIPFEELVVDEKVAGNLLMFRLGQSASAIVVHQKVYDALQPIGLRMVAFTPVGG